MRATASHSPGVIRAQAQAVTAGCDLLKVVGLEQAMVIQCQLILLSCPVVRHAQRAGPSQRRRPLLSCASQAQTLDDERKHARCN